MHKKAFTLIEMIIVIVIVSVLMTATMFFGASRIQKYQYQVAKEEMITAYEDVYSHLISSNYYSGQRYAQLELSFVSGEDQFSIAHDNQLSYIHTFGSFFTFSGMMLGDENIQDVTLTYTPYQIGCNIFSDELTGSILSFVFGSDKKKYCFNIHESNCQLKEISCEDIE